MDLDSLNPQSEAQLDWTSILTQLDHNNQVDQPQLLQPQPNQTQTQTQPFPPLSNSSYGTNSFGTNRVGFKPASVEEMKEMVFRMAALQPIQIDPESVKPPKRRNVKVSKDPQSVAARLRRERISEKIRILQRLVPGGTKMDTASMLDEAVQYMKFLKTQVSLASSSSSYSSVVSGINVTNGINICYGRQRKVISQGVSKQYI